MVKIGEETLANGQVMEIFQNGAAIIKTPLQQTYEEPKKTIYTNYEFNLKLGIENIVAIIQASKTNSEIEAFKYILDNCGNRIDTTESYFWNGMDRLVYYGLITQDIYNSFL